MKNLRFKWTGFKSFPRLLIQVPRANHMIAKKEKYSEQVRLEYAKTIMNGLRKKSNTKTLVYGKENLPKDDNYIMYSNHQGKYDAFGIFLAMERPTSVLFGKKQASKIVARQLCGLVDAVVIDQESVEDAVRCIKEIIRQVKSTKNMLIFPEGGYKNNRNELQEFQTGCFSCSLKSKKPIVPVVIYDSWRSMNSNTFEKVVTQVHFLPAIPYEEFKDLKKKEIADLVKSRIVEKLKEIKEGTVMGSYETIA